MERMTPEGRTEKYGSALIVRKHGISDKGREVETRSGVLIAKSNYVPDPLWHRYEVIDSEGVVVHVTADSVKAENQLQAVVNQWLQDNETKVEVTK